MISSNDTPLSLQGHCRLDQLPVDPTSEHGTHNWSDDVDGKKAKATRTRQRDWAPTGEKSKQAWPEIASRIEPRLSQRSNYRNKNRNCQSNEYGSKPGLRRRHIAIISDRKHHNGKDQRP